MCRRLRQLFCFQSIVMTHIHGQLDPGALLTLGCWDSERHLRAVPGAGAGRGGRPQGRL